MERPANRRLRVAACQYFVRPVESFEQFADQVAAVVETAAGYEAKLLVLPEYFTIQLVSLSEPKRPIHELVREVTEHVPRFVDLMANLAGEHELYIVAGTIPTFDPETERVHNDSYFFSPSGDHAVQGKLHMTRFEREDWHVSERSEIKVFDTPLGRMATAICYDVEFPEVVRALGNEGVHILAVPSSTDDRHGFLRVRYCAHARAIENQMYVIQASTVGSLPRVPDVSLNYGKASVLSPCDFPFGRDGIVAEGVVNQEQIIIAELDMHLVEESRSFGTVIPLEDSRRSNALTSNIEVVPL
ncbi:MAG: carbon-nitrogen hydrolase family protein [Myxococcota bacterium]